MTNAENQMPETQYPIKRKTIFIDRDGTLIEEVNHLARTEDLRFFPFTDQAVQMLKADGFLIIVVTNQSGIGRKIFTESAMHEIHAQIQNELTVKLDGFYFCPHLPDEGCRCRKPNLGMIEAACAAFPVDLENSWIIGDKALDMALGFNAGIKTALVLTGYGANHQTELSKKPDIVADNLLEAVKIILGKS